MILLMVTGCRQETSTAETCTPDPALADITSRMMREYMDAWSRKDLEAVLSYLDTGFVNMYTIGMDDDYEQCRYAWQSIFDQNDLEVVKYERLEFMADVNTAYEIGVLEQNWYPKNSTDTIHAIARGLSIYKKQSDGSWKIYRLFVQQ
jgi:ketosteroid isomerase-like protein